MRWIVEGYFLNLCDLATVRSTFRFLGLRVVAFPKCCVGPF